MLSDRVGDRRWIKLWVGEWLEGTTRYVMSDAQRAFWIDLLAMAGRSRVPGVVCSGIDGKKMVGYPVSKFRALAGESFDVVATLELFKSQGKIEYQITHEIPEPLYAITVIKWSHYQSEADRVRKYRTQNVTPDVTENVRECCPVEGEGEGEGERTLMSEPGGSDLIAAVRDVWNYYVSEIGKSPLYTFSPSRRKKGLSRLRESLKKTGGNLPAAIDLMKCAVDALKGSEFHMGKNDQKKLYNDWDTPESKAIFGSQSSFERWLERANQ